MIAIGLHLFISGLNICLEGVGERDLEGEGNGIKVVLVEDLPEGGNV